MRNAILFLPFKGRIEVGMGLFVFHLIPIVSGSTHPHPGLPLEGEGEFGATR
jgi:hypothetical protein